jgi:uncharacterized membrane protein HdeD (DUF308 family)
VREWTGWWWVVILVGLLCVAAGIIVLAKPDISLPTLSVVVGIFLLVDGIFEIAGSFSRQTPNRGLLALLGVLSAIVGVILVRHPIAGVVAAALLIGIWLISFGIVHLVDAFDQSENRLWTVILALLELAAGIVIVASPDIGVATLAILVGIGFILRGVALCVLGWSIRSVRRSIPAT